MVVVGWRHIVIVANDAQFLVEYIGNTIESSPQDEQNFPQHPPLVAWYGLSATRLIALSVKYAMPYSVIAFTPSPFDSSFMTCHFAPPGVKDLSALHVNRLSETSACR